MRIVSPMASMPFRLGMPFRFTSRLGETRPCLSDVTKSVPPARISVSPKSPSSRPMAVSRSVGLAYSKEFMLSLHLLFFSAARTRSAVSGSVGTRTPMALATALEMAAPGEMTGGSPRPITPCSSYPLPVIMWTRSLPTSRKAGQAIKLHVGIQHAAGLLDRKSLLRTARR